MMKPCLICTLLVVLVFGCRTSLKGVVIGNLASVTVDELARDDYATFQVQIKSLAKNGFQTDLRSFVRGSGAFGTVVPEGRYKVFLDYFDNAQKKIYSADFCTGDVRNNEITLNPGANLLRIKVCREDSSTVDNNNAWVVITPVLSGNLR